MNQSVKIQEILKKVINNLVKQKIINNFIDGSFNIHLFSALLN